MSLTLSKRTAISGFLFISVWIAGFLIFFLIPLIKNFQLSLTDARLNTITENTYQFIGIQNYIEAFTVDIEFVPYLLETTENLIFDVPFILAFSLAVAWLVVRPGPFRVGFQAIYFLPVVIGSAVVIGRIFDFFGNSLILFQGRAAQEFLFTFLGDRLPTFLTFLNRSVFVLWRSGVQILIFIAGLKSIDPSLYEAAEVDGANAWNSFWKITLPMLSPVILFNVVYTVIDSFTDYFNTVLRYIRVVTFQSSEMRMGYPSALGNIYFIIIFILVIIVFGLLSRITFYRGER